MVSDIRTDSGKPRKPGTWAKGVSGNPHGRPKALIDVQAIARQHTKRNIEVLVELRDTCEDASVRLRAAVSIHEIAWGKPSQSVSSDVTLQAGDTLTTFLLGLRDGNAR